LQQKSWAQYLLLPQPHPSRKGSRIKGRDSKRLFNAASNRARPEWEEGHNAEGTGRHGRRLERHAPLHTNGYIVGGRNGLA